MSIVKILDLLFVIGIVALLLWLLASNSGLLKETTDAIIQ